MKIPISSTDQLLIGRQLSCATAALCHHLTLNHHDTGSHEWLQYALISFDGFFCPQSQLSSNSPTTFPTQQLNMMACSCLSMLHERTKKNQKLDGLVFHLLISNSLQFPFFPLVSQVLPFLYVWPCWMSLPWLVYCYCSCSAGIYFTHSNLPLLLMDLLEGIIFS